MSPATSTVKSPDDKSISVPSIVILSTTTPAFAVTTPLKEAAPASLPSKVNIVISAVLSVPLNIISVSLAAASIVIFPELVDIDTAESPAVISSAATEAALPAAPKDKFPDPSVFKTSPLEPSDEGKINVKSAADAGP